MKSNNFEKEKLDRDYQIKEKEIGIRQKEVELKEKELLNNRRKLTSVHASIILAIIGVAGSLIGAWIQSRSNLEQERMKHQPEINVKAPVADSILGNKKQSKSPQTKASGDVPSRNIKNTAAEPVLQKTQEVYICKSANAHVYHKSQTCMGLSHCASVVEKVLLEDALKMNKRPCGIEY